MAPTSSNEKQTGKENLGSALAHRLRAAAPRRNAENHADERGDDQTRVFAGGGAGFESEVLESIISKQRRSHLRSADAQLR